MGVEFSRILPKREIFQKFSENSWTQNFVGIFVKIYLKSK